MTKEEQMKFVRSRFPDAYEKVYASRSMVIWCDVLKCRLSGFFLTFDEAWADAVEWIKRRDDAYTQYINSLNKG